MDDCRYTIVNGKRILIGLSAAETLEFETLDKTAPVLTDGTVSWSFEGRPKSALERRWLALFCKHERAFLDSEA